MIKCSVWCPRLCLIFVSIWLMLAASCSGAANPGVGVDVIQTGASTAEAVRGLPPTATPSPSATPIRREPSPILSPSPSTTPDTRELSPIISPLPTATPGNGELLPGSPSLPADTYRIINVYPHDRNAWTQGLVVDEGTLYEGTGKLGRSTLRRVELETGDILQSHALPDHFFGEGITVFGGRIYQLTWKSRTGFVYDKDSFELLQTFSYPTEGWGITHDGERLIMSDGTATLRFLDPHSLQEVDQIQAQAGGVPIPKLNELEFIRGEIWANVWQTDGIVRIDPETGEVSGWIDLRSCCRQRTMSNP